MKDVESSRRAGDVTTAEVFRAARAVIDRFGRVATGSSRGRARIGDGIRIKSIVSTPACRGATGSPVRSAAGRGARAAAVIAAIATIASAADNARGAVGLDIVIARIRCSRNGRRAARAAARGSRSLRRAPTATSSIPYSCALVECRNTRRSQSTSIDRRNRRAINQRPAFHGNARMATIAANNVRGSRAAMCSDS